MTLTIVPSDGSAQPTPVTVTVPKQGKFDDLVRALGITCSLGDEETLMVAEVSSCTFQSIIMAVCFLIIHLF